MNQYLWRGLALLGALFLISMGGHVFLTGEAGLRGGGQTTGLPAYSLGIIYLFGGITIFIKIVIKKTSSS
jgi:hypothetical protein